MESTSGKGSRFFFSLSLPAALGQVRDDEATAWEGVERLAMGYKVRALVVDDVAENRDILRRILEQLGAQVETAENGRMALEQLERSVPDIVFLDIRMPVIDGLEAMQRLRQNAAWEAVKVAAISASVLDHERDAYMRAGFDDFLAKPFRIERLCACLATLLDVEFDYGDQPRPAVVEEPVDWRNTVLPGALLQRLRESAQNHSITEIELHLQEMESLGEEARRLAAHLRQLKQRYDRDAIIDLLEEVSHG